MTKSELVDVTVIVQHRTAAAVLVKYDEDKAAIWLPLSQIELGQTKGATYVVTLPRWLAEEKGMV